MGVDFYTCSNETCGYNFPDCGYYFTCTTCEDMFCSDECGGREKIFDENGIPKESREWGGYESTCIHCRMEAISSADMVRFLLAKLGLTYEEAADQLRAQSKNDKENG